MVSKKFPGHLVETWNFEVESLHFKLSPCAFTLGNDLTQAKMDAAPVHYVLWRPPRIACWPIIVKLPSFVAAVGRTPARFNISVFPLFVSSIPFSTGKHPHSAWALCSRINRTCCSFGLTYVFFYDLLFQSTLFPQYIHSKNPGFTKAPQRKGLLHGLGLRALAMAMDRRILAYFLIRQDDRDAISRRYVYIYIYVYISF